MVKKNKITFTSPGKGKPKTILLNGHGVGAIRKIEKSTYFKKHWQGALTNHRSEIWTIAETTLKEVENRVREAFYLAIK